MALLISDGMALYGNYLGALTAKNWTANPNIPQANYRTTGRFGAGSYSLNFFYNFNVTGMNQAISPSGSTTVVGFAFNLQGNGGSLSNQPLLTLYNGSNYVTVWASTPTGSTGFLNLVIRWGSAAPFSTLEPNLVYTTTLNMSQSQWYYVEFKVNWAATTGQCILRVDGTQVYDSGATLALGAANATAMYFGALGGSTYYPLSFSLTDVLVMDGTGTTFNDFQGDVRVETLFPTSDGTNTGWTVGSLPNLVPSTNVSRFSTDTSGWSILSGTGTAIARMAAASSPVSPYVDNFKLPNYCAVSMGSAAGWQIMSNPTGTSGFAVIPGHVLGVSIYSHCQYAVTCQLGLRFWNSGGTVVGGDLTFNFTTQNSWQSNGPGTITVPATAATAAVVFGATGSSTYVVNITGICVTDGGTAFQYQDPGTGHYPNIVEMNPDGDATYVSTNTLSAKDTYHLSSLLSASGTVLGVKSVLVGRREAAGARVVSPVVRVSGTDYVGTTGFTPPATLAYGPGENVWAVSPATSAAWTRTEVNAMEIGPQLTT